jgi:hypothetical protein
MRYGNKKKKNRMIPVREEDITKADFLANLNGIKMPRVHGFSIMNKSMPVILSQRIIKKKKKGKKLELIYKQEFEI